MEKTLLICDGCQLPPTDGNLVRPMTLDQDDGTGSKVVLKADAHGINCFGRVITRWRGDMREQAKRDPNLKTKAKKKAA